LIVPDLYCYILVVAHLKKRELFQFCLGMPKHTWIPSLLECDALGTGLEVGAPGTGLDFKGIEVCVMQAILMLKARGVN
jgi:hypothetical protein